jgi:hypothetical protein
MWVKLDDKFPRHPKVLQAGPLAAWLYVCGLVYCGQFLTDGVVPKAVVPTLADFGSVPGAPSIAELVEQLLSVGLWERVPGGYRIHDYLDYNPSREAVRCRSVATGNVW